MSQHDRINKNTSLFLLTWPILVELLLQMLIGNVDQMMISRYSQNAVAAYWKCESDYESTTDYL